jgi:hypothetical protein
MFFKLSSKICYEINIIKNEYLTNDSKNNYYFVLLLLL